jgi:WD40-like Beta Propeller Repeat
MTGRRVLLAAVAAAAVALASAEAASASAIYYVCGKDLCRYDVASKRSSHLTTNGTKRKPYTDISASRSGRRFGLIYGSDLFSAGPGLRGRHSLEDDVTLVFARPDGAQLASLQLRLTPNPACIPPMICPPLLTPWLYLYSPNGKKEDAVAARTVTAGWLRNRLMRDEFENGVQVICVLKQNDDFECDRNVAQSPDFDLMDPEGSPNGRFLAATAVPEEADDNGDVVVSGRIALFNPATGGLVRMITAGSDDSDPAFSPDGTTIAFERGKSIYVAPASGGRAKRLIRRGSRPSWALG